MDIQDLHSILPLPSSCPNWTFDGNLVPIVAERWKAGERTTQQILSVIQPNANSEKKRKDIIEYIQALIEESFGVKVFPFGSVPLKTYLPHGDLDLTAFSHNDSNQDLAADICNLLKDEEKNNASIEVKDVLYVPAQVGVVKCIVGDIAVDISFNQTAGLCALCFFEQVDQYIGKDHLFKRSLILIKSWCFYESRLLGGFHGLISTYALKTMVLHVINHFHSSLGCPLAVLYKFLYYYCSFDWEAYCVSISGLVVISSLPRIEVCIPDGSDDEVLLPDAFLRNSKEAVSFYTGFTGTQRPPFPVKFLNILDPLRDDNNLGRCVSKGNFYRIKCALSYGMKKLYEVLTSEPETVSKRLENFFINTLKSNGRGRREDLCVPTPQYDAEIFSTYGESDDFLSGFQYSLWFHNYVMIYQPQPNKYASQKIWNDGWYNKGRYAWYDHSMYRNVDESSLFSIDRPINLQLLKAASIPEGGKCRGTGPYIPRLDHLRGLGIQENGNDDESQKENGRVYSQACTHTEAATSVYSENSCSFNFSVEDFPLLPGSKPVSIKAIQPGYSRYDLDNESLSSLDTLEFGRLKYSLSESVKLSERDKQSTSDVSVILDSSIEEAVPNQDDSDLSNIEEKIEEMQPLELSDEEEFPPLNQPSKLEIRFTKKEFPSLDVSLHLEKMKKWRKKLKEVPKSY